MINTRFASRLNRRSSRVAVLAALAATAVAAIPAQPAHAAVVPCKVTGPFFAPAWQGMKPLATASVTCLGAPAGTRTSISLTIKKGGVAVGRNMNSGASHTGVRAESLAGCGRGTLWQAVAVITVTAPTGIPAAQVFTTGAPTTIC